MTAVAVNIGDRVTDLAGHCIPVHTVHIDLVIAGSNIFVAVLAFRTIHTFIAVDGRFITYLTAM
jgi:hypothetical protein